MVNDIAIHRMVIGLFYFRLRPVSKKTVFVRLNFFVYILLFLIFRLKQIARTLPKMLNKYYFSAFYQNISFTLFLLQLLLLSNDIAENPGPESSELSVFHWNARSIRHKIDYLQAISNESSVICITESHLDETCEPMLTSDTPAPPTIQHTKYDRTLLKLKVQVNQEVNKPVGQKSITRYTSYR